MSASLSSHLQYQQHHQPPSLSHNHPGLREHSANHTATHQSLSNNSGFLPPPSAPNRHANIMKYLHANQSNKENEQPAHYTMAPPNHINPLLMNQENIAPYHHLPPPHGESYMHPPLAKSLQQMSQAGMMPPQPQRASYVSKRAFGRDLSNMQNNSALAPISANQSGDSKQPLLINLQNKVGTPLGPNKFVFVLPMFHPAGQPSIKTRQYLGSASQQQNFQPAQQQQAIPDQARLSLNHPQILPPNTTTNQLAKLKNIPDMKTHSQDTGKLLPSFIQNVNPIVLQRPTGGRFIERKNITCLSQERAPAQVGAPASASYNNLSTRSGMVINGLKGGAAQQSFLQNIPQRAQSTVGTMPQIVSKQRDMSSVSKNNSQAHEQLSTNHKNKSTNAAIRRFQQRMEVQSTHWQYDGHPWDRACTANSIPRSIPVGVPNFIKRQLNNLSIRLHKASQKNS